ncbi:MAG: hypothetical protein EBV03_02815 [Proteobacteria bacterium]|nr:hypothetical protein [Pseudomonadota bacterium]
MGFFNIFRRGKVPAAARTSSRTAQLGVEQLGSRSMRSGNILSSALIHDAEHAAQLEVQHSLPHIETPTGMSSLFAPKEAVHVESTTVIKPAPGKPKTAGGGGTPGHTTIAIDHETPPDLTERLGRNNISKPKSYTERAETPPYSGPRQK